MDKTKMAVDVFDKCAGDYQDKFMDTTLYHDTFDLFCDNITNKSAHILELACGPGNITRYLLNKRPDFKILGTDLSPNMLTLAKINNPEAEFQLMDCRDIWGLEQSYDAIMCGFCLPYLSKEEVVQLISDASKLLKPNGVFYVSTMEDDYGKSGIQTSGSGNQLYIRYHQEDYLVRALEENGFEIIDMERKEYKEQNGAVTTDLIIITRK